MDREREVEGVKKGPFEGDFALMYFIFLFSCIPFVFFLAKMFLLFVFFLVFLSKRFHCWHWYHSIDVSSVVGAPWRCGVVTT